MADVTIRTAGAADAATIVRLIRELAAYENLLDLVEITAADVRRDAFGARVYFEALLAERGGAAVGLATHRPCYSTFGGRPGLYVEDLFVAASARELGIGRLLMARLAAIAKERGCSHLTSRCCTGTPRASSTIASASHRSRSGCPTGCPAPPSTASPPRPERRFSSPVERARRGQRPVVDVAT